MKSVSLSEDQSPLARAAADGLRALGWAVTADQAGAQLRVEFVDDLSAATVGRGDWGSVVFSAAAPDRLGLSELSVHVQKLAVAAAPQVRVNGVAVAEGWQGELASTIDWLAGAEMVTGQMILLSGEPGPTIPF